MSLYRDFWYKSNDGLKLYARDYPHDTPRDTVLCIAGLTRNSADFSGLCEHLSQQYRVIAVDLRGRGRSNYDPNPLNYHPRSYLNDVISLLDALKLPSVIVIGTSLGGLITMLLASVQPHRVTAAIINDIGPEVSQLGLDRIKAYISNPTAVTSWPQAIDATQQLQGQEYPDFTPEDWESFTKNIYREDSAGMPVLNYDPAIAVLLEQDQDKAVTADLWPLFKAMHSIPLLLVRGQLSDILTQQCVSRMQQIKTDMHYLEIPNRGHAPLLTEPLSLQAIDQFLDALAIDKS